MKTLKEEMICNISGGCTLTTPAFILIIDFVPGAPALNGLIVAAQNPSAWNDCP